MAQIMQVECQLNELLSIQFEEKRHFFDDLSLSSGKKLPPPGSVWSDFADTQGAGEQVFPQPLKFAKLLSIRQISTS
jgi:hypothetical protein